MDKKAALFLLKGNAIIKRTYENDFSGYRKFNICASANELVRMLAKKGKTRSLQKYGTVAVCLLIMLFWVLGWTDHIFEKPYSKFKWSPFIDVREQVLLELSGRPASHVYENDWAYFEAFHYPACEELDRHENRFLLIIVKSSPLNFLKREAIRATWGSVSNCSEFRIKTIFVMGRLTSTQQNKRLQEEINLHNDILVGDYIDSYRNNTLKFLSGIQFSFDYCHQQYAVPYALLVDDDYLVLVQNLVAEAKKHDVRDRLYMGWRFDTRPFRTRFHKHRVSLATYPFDRYPPYISAGAVLLSLQSIREIYYAIQHTRLYVYDDIYAGILAKLLKLPVTHNKNMRFWEVAVRVQDAPTLICAHGFEEEHLKSVYSELKAKGFL